MIVPKCPKCARPLMSRTAKLCSFCGEKLPAELLFSPTQLAALERDALTTRALRVAQAGLPLESSSPTAPRDRSSDRPWRAVRAERLAAFLAHIGYPLDHPNAARWKAAGAIDEGEWEITIADCPNHFALDGRKTLKDALPPILARLAQLGVAVAAEFSADGAEATLQRGDRRGVLRYRPKENQFHDAALATLNTLLRGEYELRADENVRGGDTDGYLLLSAEQWTRLAAEFPQFAPAFRTLEQRGG